VCDRQGTTYELEAALVADDDEADEDEAALLDDEAPLELDWPTL
jgi:hypothetical protein